MKQIVIIGGSSAGVKAAEEIRAVNPEISIKILLWENHVPFNRQVFPQFLANEISIDKLYVRPKSFFEQQKIDLVFDKKISRINFKRGQISFEDKDKLDYDALLITDLPLARFPDVKGTQRIGNFALRRVTDAGEIFKLLPATESVAIQSQTLAGLRLALALRKKEKEVFLIFPDTRILSAVLDEESDRMLRILLDEQGIRIFDQNEIAEVLGDTEVKAVRLKSGKVIAVQLVLWPDALPDLRILKETELQADEQVSVNANFQTNISNVFCLDDVCSSSPAGCSPDQDQYGQVLEQQGKVVAAAVNGHGMVAEFLASSYSLKFSGNSFCRLGDTLIHSNTLCAVEADPDRKVLKKFYVCQGVLVGAVLINADEEIEKSTARIRERFLVSQSSDRIWQALQETQSVLLNVASDAAAGTDPALENKLAQT